MPGGRLPVSGTSVWLREANGEDELLVLQDSRPAPATVLELAGRLAVGADDAPIDWLALPAVELGAAALLIRGAWIGDRIHSESMCPTEGCAEPVDVSFDIAEFLDYHRPQRTRAAIEREAGVFTLRDAEVRFRVPTIADMMVAIGHGGTALIERCVEPPNASEAVLRRVDRALESLAPRLDGVLSGTCPGCGHTIALWFDPVDYVLAELRDACAGLYAQVHDLALSYHWTEQAILALGRRRRNAYVAMIHGELAVV